MTIKYPEIAEKLEKIFEKDQKDILLEDQEERKKRVSENTQFLKDIISEIGWPTISKVGENASGIAWFLAQHSDYHLDFQKQCLELMQSQPKGEVKTQNIAYLIDRTRKNAGEPQLYGSQFEKNWELWKVEDPEHLDERRKEMGLSSIDTYIKQSKKYHSAPEEKK